MDLITDKKIRKSLPVQAENLGHIAGVALNNAKNAVTSGGSTGLKTGANLFTGFWKGLVGKNLKEEVKS